MYFRGGFGSVYAGVRLSDNKMVAIKHVPRSTVRLWCSSSGHSVPREICLLRHVSGSSNVVRLLDFYERHDRLEAALQNFSLVFKIHWTHTFFSFILILSKPSCYKDLFDYISERGSLDETTATKFFKQVTNHEIFSFHWDWNIFLCRFWELSKPWNTKMSYTEISRMKIF